MLLFKKRPTNDTMPRDLSLEKKTDVLDSMAPLTREPEGGAPPVTSFGFADGLEHGAQGKYHLAMLDEEEDEDRARRRNELNVFPESLNVGYLEQIAALEYAAFPEEEACTREKVIDGSLTFSPLPVATAARSANLFKVYIPPDRRS